jgi:hypothetical protein
MALEPGHSGIRQFFRSRPCRLDSVRRGEVDACVSCRDTVVPVEKGRTPAASDPLVVEIEAQGIDDRPPSLKSTETISSGSPVGENLGHTSRSGRRRSIDSRKRRSPSVRGSMPAYTLGV